MMTAREFNNMAQLREERDRLRAENSHLHHQTNKLGAEVLRLRELLREAREFLGDNDKEDTLIRAIDAALKED